MPHTPIDPDSEAGILIQRLGYAGLVPFVGLALLLWVVSIEVHAFVSIALTGYAALIASFLGGIHWGIGLRHNAPQRQLHMVWGVTPSLVAWVALLMPAFAGLPVLALLLIACYLVDRKTWPEAGLREWMTLRFRLTVISTLSCLIGAGAT